jgi:predicted ATPase
MVAATFAVADTGSRSVTGALIASLRQKHLLLILDNCEHVLLETARVASAILRSCRDITILATSREPLSVGGEHVWRVQPLSFPEHPQRITAKQALEYGAIRLFVERAEAALGGFAITDPIAPLVAEICKRLDGIALAIELAVPRLKMLKPEELLARLKERFQLLTQGDRSALPRQQTLLATTDWSYRLLNEHEQVLLRRLAIFPDTFTIDSAEAVCGWEPIDPRDVLDLVASLVDKSLVVPVVTTQGASRYKLLESTRAFGLDRLRESTDMGCQRRLAEYFIRSYEEAERLWDTTPDTQWYDAYEPDLDNVRATLTWAFGPEGDTLLGVALVAHTLHLAQWWSRAQRQRWFAVAGAKLGDIVPPFLVGRIKLAMADCTGAHRGQREGSAQALEAAEIFRRLGDPKNRAWALTIAADSLIDAADTKEAESYYQEAEALLRPFGATKQLASVLGSKAVRRGLWAGDTASARTLFAESLSLARTVGYRRLIEATTIHLGELEAIDGLFDAAIARAREAETASRQSGNEYFLNVALANLSGYLLAVGDVASARAAGVEALHLARSHGDSYWINGVLERLAFAAALSGDATRAARLAGYCEAMYRLDAAPRERVEHRTWQALIERLDAVLAPAEKTRLMADGAAWDEEQAAAAALEQ